MKFREIAGKLLTVATCLAALAPWSTFAQGSVKPELRIGVVLAASGGAASIGLPERSSVALLADQLADAKLPFTVKIVSYDDASDPSKSANAVRRLIQEDKVHLVVCCTTTPRPEN